MKKIITACALCATMLTGISVPATTNVKAEVIQTKKTKQSNNGLKIIDSGYYVVPANEYIDTAYVHYWAKVKKMDKKRSIQFPVITATAKDDAGKVLGSASQTGFSIAPKDTVVLTSQMDTGNTAATTVDIKVKKPKYSSAKVVSSKSFKVDNISTVPDENYMDKVTGELTYSGKKDLDMVAITAIYKSGDKSVFAETSFLDNVEGKSTESFEVQPLTTAFPEYDNVEVYVQNWG